MTTPKASYTDFVHDVVRESPEPLSFDEIVYRVNKRQRITTKNPAQTIRSAIGSSRLIVNTGEHRYAWKYRAINGAVLYIPLTKAELNKRQLTYPEEVREVLAPTFFQSGKRGEREPAQVTLPDGATTEWALEHFVKTDWGTHATHAFWIWLEAQHAQPHDGLILRVTDGEAHRYAVEFQARAARDMAQVAQRNQEIVDAALAYFKRTPHGAALWDIAAHLLAIGAYKHPVPPDPLEKIWTPDVWEVELAKKPVTHEWVHESEMDSIRTAESVLEQIALPRPARRKGKSKTQPASPAAERNPLAIVATNVYVLHITLLDTHPPIWRRVQVPGNILLSELHGVLQLAMGWTNSHLHQFRIGAHTYSIPDDASADFPDMIDERGVTLEQVAALKTKFLYDYDFGDSWAHEIRVEQIRPPRRVEYPTCLEGARKCPPEDVGGTWGYQEFLEALRHPKHAEHDEYLEWVGGAFDPKEFDRDRTNRALWRFGRELMRP